MSLISVITINYNNAKGLEQTLFSVFNQTFSDFEYIVVDGGSTDGSRELLERYSGSLSSWVSEPDGGIYDAMNKGINRARGEYLLFINSGDKIYRHDTLKKASRFLNTKYDIVYGNMKIDNNGVISDGFMPEKMTLSQMMNDTLWHPVSFIKKDLFIRFGLFDTGFKICGDYDFFFKTVIANAVKTRHIKLFVAVFELNGMSSDYANVSVIADEKERIQKKYLTAAKIDRFREEEMKKSKRNFFSRWFQ